MINIIYWLAFDGNCSLSQKYERHYCRTDAIKILHQQSKTPQKIF